MKIIAWNVNGLRAALGKGALDWAWNQKPDLLLPSGNQGAPRSAHRRTADFSRI